MRLSVRSYKRFRVHVLPSSLLKKYEMRVLYQKCLRRSQTSVVINSNLTRARNLVFVCYTFYNNAHYSRVSEMFFRIFSYCKKNDGTLYL